MRPGQDHRRPGEADGGAAKVAHVGIEGFTTGHSQEHAAEDQQGKTRLFDQHAEAIPWIDGEEDLQVVEDVDEAHDAEHDEPHQVTGAKSEATPAVPLYWKVKSVIENGQCQRHDDRLEALVDDGQDLPPQKAPTWRA